jgi:alkylated DNA repair dioxygenase AlkB
MKDQRELFVGMDMEENQDGPRGFRYRDGIISEETQKILVSELNRLNLQPFEFHGYLGNRRVANFGLKYDFTRRSVQKAEDIPSFLEVLLVLAADFAGCEKSAFRQVAVNEYQAGAGIGWHKDKPEFRTIVGVSLLAPALIRFRRPQGDKWSRVSHKLNPRSIYVLAGQSRTDWEHSIPPLGALRYSITFRTLSTTQHIPDLPDSQGSRESRTV